MRELAPIWPADQPHLSIETIRDWFASYVYLPRLRDEAVLDDALQKLVEDMGRPYAFAGSFDEQARSYAGAIDSKAMLPGSLGAELLVRREALPEPEAPKPHIVPGDEERDKPGGQDRPPPSGDPEPAPPPNPRRFFAALTIDPERAGLEVARIMEGLLVELTRTPGSRLKLTLEMESSAGETGYPEDVVKTVKANACDLRLDDDNLRFAED